MRIDLPPGPPPSSLPPSAPAAKSQAPSDRATTFQAVEGGEQHSGSVLLVEAYAAIWLFLLGFLLMQWRKQAQLHARLDELEKVVDRAAERLDASASATANKGTESAAAGLAAKEA